MNDRFCTVAKVARVCDVDVETVRRWCRKRDVVAKLTPGGKGQWRIAVDEKGWPVRG